MPILKLNNVNTYYGKSHILQGITFNLDKPGCLALLGRNGAGKTTTLRSIVNLTKLSSGDIIFNNNNFLGFSIPSKSVLKPYEKLGTNPTLFGSQLKDSPTSSRTFAKSRP